MNSWDMKDEKPRKPRRPTAFPFPFPREGRGTLDHRPRFLDQVLQRYRGSEQRALKFIASTQSGEGIQYSPCDSSVQLCQISSRMQAAGGMQSAGKGIALRQCRKSMLSISMRKNRKLQLNQRAGRSLWRRHLEGLSEPS